MKNEKYTPALRFGVLTRFYDPLVKYSTRENSFKKALLEQATLTANQCVLDLACGTGTLSINIKQYIPNAEIYGYDADEKILRLARIKAEKFDSQINFVRGYSDQLPFEKNTFDRIFSTLAFHHLLPEKKIATIGEILRVLKPDGEFHLADYGLPRGKKQFALSMIVQAIDGIETTDDNLRGRLKILLSENGFSKVEEKGYFKTILGTIRLFKAFNPG